MWGSWPLFPPPAAPMSVVLSSSNLRGPLSLSWMVANCSGERSFSRLKIIKNEFKGHNVPGVVAHTKHSVH